MLSSLVLVAGCSDDGGRASSAAASITTAPPSTGTTDLATTTAAVTTGATSSGGEGEGSSGAQPTTAEPTGTSTGDATTTGVKLDLGVTPDFGGGDTDAGTCERQCQADQAGQVGGDWLLHIGDQSLYLVDVADASTAVLCDGVPPAKSLTFTRDNRLFSSSGDMLHAIDPCACTSVEIGSYPQGYGNIYGIAPDEGNGLFGISAQASALVRINTQTAETTEVGPLGVNVGLHGAAWSEQDQTLYMITSNRLYTVDVQTGAASEIAVLDADFSTVGVEQHPATGLLYGCTGDGALYEIDKLTAQTTLIGPIEGVSGCTNLGAPWTGTEVCLPIPG